MKKTKIKSCVICKKTGTLIKAGHVCLICFQKATEPKVIQISDKGAENLGRAYAVANFVQWGIQKLLEASGMKVPLPSETAEQEAKRQREARDNLKELQQRLIR